MRKFLLLIIFSGLLFLNGCVKNISNVDIQTLNQKAAEYKKILSDPDKIQDIFKLANFENKFLILQNMSEADLDELLPYLNEEQLSKGLNFFKSHSHVLSLFLL